VAARVCPLCMGKVPAGEIAAYSNTMVCPHCQKPLEVSRPSRLITTLVGVVAAYFVYRFTRGSEGLLGWVLPLVYAVLAWGIVTPLLLMWTGDLRVRAEQPYGEPLRAPVAQGSSGHH
jgi:hypothetical protein